MNEKRSMIVRPCSITEAKRMIASYHYAGMSPLFNRYALGLYQENILLGVVLLGWGTQPRHTIQRLFPSLGVQDYLEINRLWVSDDLPRNTESWFLARIQFWCKAYTPAKLVFAWADGLRGKPGYVYQASGFLYGGYIESEFYIAISDGEVIHPRLVVTRQGSRARIITEAMGLRKLRGRQFRYIKFLCHRGEQKRLLRESRFDWMQKYPKSTDCIWWENAGEGARESRELPKLKGSGQYRHPAPMFPGNT